MMEIKTIGTQCNVWPRCHAYKDMGPFDIRLAHRFQHGQLLKDWHKDKIKISLSQPDPDSNLTLIRMLFGPVPKEIYPEVKWYNASTTRLNDGVEMVVKNSGPFTEDIGAGLKGRPDVPIRCPGTIRVYLRRRVCDSMGSPVPTGVWTGTLTYTDEWAYHTLQLATLRKAVVEEPHYIIVPGDNDFNESPTDPPRTV